MASFPEKVAHSIYHMFPLYFHVRFFTTKSDSIFQSASMLIQVSTYKHTLKRTAEMKMHKC